MHPTKFLITKRGTKDQVPWECNVESSSFIAGHHIQDLRANLYVDDSTWVKSTAFSYITVERKTLGLKIPLLDLVCITCVFIGGI